MFAAAITFELPEGTDWDALRAVARDRAENIYRGIPALRSKAFILDPETRAYGGLYVWESRAALQAFLDGEVFRAAVARFGTPDIRTFEVAALIEHGVVVEQTPA